MSSVATFDLFDAVLKYRADQARDARGRWTRDGGSTTLRSDAPRKPRTRSVSRSAKRVRALAQEIKRNPKSANLPKIAARVERATNGIIEALTGTPEENRQRFKEELYESFAMLGASALMVYDIGRGVGALVARTPLPIPITAYVAAGIALVGAALMLYDAYVWARDKWGSRSAKRSPNRHSAVRDLRGRG